MKEILRRFRDIALPAGSRSRTVAILFTRPHLWIGLVGLGLLTIVRRFSNVKVGLIDSTRIGHFAIDFGIRFAEESLKTSGQKTIYWVEGRIANSFWFELMRRNLTCHPMAAHISKLAPYFPSSKDWFTPSPHWVSASRDIDGVISQCGTIPRFLSSEHESARDWLRSVGWVDGQKIVCVLVRDSYFLDSEAKLTPPNWGPDGSPSWSYQAYRDSDIETFIPAMEWLADQGAFVLRMGKRMAKPLSSQHPAILDYAFHPSRNDFLDVWLFANCDLCISTGVGPDLISVVFGRPVLHVNYIPISLSVTSGPVITAGKRLYDSAGKRLSLPEHFHTNFTKTQDYSRAGITVRSLDSEKILALAKEMWRRLSEDLRLRREEGAIRAQFVDLLKTSPDANAHGWIHPAATLSEVWIEDLLVEIARNDDSGQAIEANK